MSAFLLALARVAGQLNGCACEAWDLGIGTGDWTGDWTYSGNWRARAR